MHVKKQKKKNWRSNYSQLCKFSSEKIQIWETEQIPVRSVSNCSDNLQTSDTNLGAAPSDGNGETNIDQTCQKYKYVAKISSCFTAWFHQVMQLWRYEAFWNILMRTRGGVRLILSNSWLFKMHSSQHFLKSRHWKLYFDCPIVLTKQNVFWRALPLLLHFIYTSKIQNSASTRSILL